MLIINPPGGRSLRLMHAAVEDAGRYSCIVSNAAGEERKNFDLNILGNATFIHLQRLLIRVKKLPGLKLHEHTIGFGKGTLPTLILSRLIPQSHRALSTRAHWWTRRSKRSTTSHSPARCQVKVYTMKNLCQSVFEQTWLRPDFDRQVTQCPTLSG